MKEMQTMFEKIGRISDEADVNRVFGQPKEIEGHIVIPVAEIAYGFGMGFGMGTGMEEIGDEAEIPEVEEEEKTEMGIGGGGGGGARVRPLAYIEVGPEGTQIKPVMDEQKIALAGILLSIWTVGWVGMVLKTLFKK
ncbi:MAG: spore germination protein GerW family protein [Anaerolineae bacterium]